MTRARPTGTDSRLAAHCAAIASVGAGLIHLAVIPAHWREWVPAGLFFVILAVVQLGWAAPAWSRPSPRVLAAGIAVNAGAAVLWVNSCIAGPPFGPSAGHPESVGAAGISVLLLECYVVMGAAWSWLSRHDAKEVAVPARAAVLLGAHSVMAGAVTLGLVASLHGHHHHHGPEGTAAEHGVGEQVPAPPSAPALGQPALPVTDMGAAAPESGHHHTHDGD